MSFHIKLLLLIPFALMTRAQATEQDDYYKAMKSSGTSEGVKMPPFNDQMKAMQAQSVKTKKEFEVKAAKIRQDDIERAKKGGKKEGPPGGKGAAAKNTPMPKQSVAPPPSGEKLKTDVPDDLDLSK